MEKVKRCEYFPDALYCNGRCFTCSDFAYLVSFVVLGAYMESECAFVIDRLTWVHLKSQVKQDMVTVKQKMNKEAIIHAMLEGNSNRVHADWC